MTTPVPARLLSIQVGTPRDYGSPAAADEHDLPWNTAFFKEPVPGPVFADSLGLAGDGQADRVHHGGIDKAILAYSAEHYPAWRTSLNLPDMPYGGFGENLTWSGGDETTVCIGDHWRIGDLLLEVSQPRQPCWKLSRRWRRKDLSGQVIANGRSGWYLRVLKPGELTAGLSITLIARPNPEWTVLRTHQILHLAKHDLVAAGELAELTVLAEAWRELFRKRASRRNG